MMPRGTFVVYRKELRDSLRDRRTLISMIVVPTLLMPVLVLVAGLVMNRVVRKAREEPAPIAIVGGEWAPATVAALRADARFRVVEPEGGFREAVAAKTLRAAVEFSPDFEEALERGAPAAVTLHHYEGELRSGLGVGALEGFLRDRRERLIGARLQERGLPADFVRPFRLQRRNVAPPEKVGGNLVGGVLPYFIIVLCFAGAMYPAIDLTAGEKERGTLEALLCSPVPRLAIVLGKFLMVLTASLATMVLSLVSMCVSVLVGGGLLLRGGAAGEVHDFGGAVPALDPLGVLGVAAMVVPVAVLFSALVFAISLFARSTKEAQSYVSPLLVVVILPAVLGMLPGMELNARLALVPVLNLSLVCREMLSGVWQWPYIALIFGSTCLYAGLALAAAVAMFRRESVLFRT